MKRFGVAIICVRCMKITHRSKETYGGSARIFTTAKLNLCASRDDSHVLLSDMNAKRLHFRVFIVP